MSNETDSYQMPAQQSITFEREWAMPNEETFSIPPIRALVEDELARSDGLWIDPFAGGTDLADITNDLNPAIESDHTLDAVQFLKRFENGAVDGGVLFDPPYSPTQVKECYESVGLEMMERTTRADFWGDAKREIERVCAGGATVITCGWNSGGIGKTAGFSPRRILLVPHGGWHNDTIATVEDRIRFSLAEFDGPEVGG